ncbi:MAG: hypothetical protein MUE41_15040 [Gemmatimonadaceae bacterium]|nr:hypothetical protein [Gemmatimonadaceae bacterium]
MLIVLAVLALLASIVAPVQGTRAGGEGEASDRLQLRLAAACEAASLGDSVVVVRLQTASGTSRVSCSPTGAIIADSSTRSFVQDALDRAAGDRAP